MMRFDPNRIEIASISDTGRQRSNNQDSYGEGRAPSGARWIMVADGMGGHAGGATASRVAVETVSSVVASSSDAPDVALRSALEAANRMVHDEAQRNEQLAGMGTTGVAALFSSDGTAFVANVGDSRAYRMRNGALEQITIDHSLVAEMHRRGMITEEEALVHPRRNEVLRSLGVEPDVQVDLHQLELEPGDLFLLCSDGLSGVVRDAEIAAVMHREAPAQAVRTLVDFANSRGGPDNVTVQIARIPGPEPDPQPAHDAKQVRALTFALVAVASVLAAILVWTLVGELRAPTVPMPAAAPPTTAAPAPSEAPAAVPTPARHPAPLTPGTPPKIDPDS
jgi:serine/threonine protein phosphatase PrpC